MQSQIIDPKKLRSFNNQKSQGQSNGEIVHSEATLVTEKSVQHGCIGPKAEYSGQDNTAAPCSRKTDAEAKQNGAAGWDSEFG